MKKRLYLMRHGQTLFNVRRKVQGWCDAPLTELGKKQAEFAKKYFTDNKIIFDSAYSSTAERASDTLEIITDLPYKRLKGLKEWNFGTFEGESEDLNPPLPYKDFFKEYGGEGELELRKRLVDTLTKVMQEDEGNVIFAVSHGAACVQFARHWEANSKIGLVKKFKNCGILKFEFEDNKFTLVDIENHDYDALLQ